MSTFCDEFGSTDIDQGPDTTPNGPAWVGGMDRETGYDDSGTKPCAYCGTGTDGHINGTPCCEDCADPTCTTAGCENDWTTLRDGDRYCVTCAAGVDDFRQKWAQVTEQVPVRGRR